jgi:hypothetical protein
MASNPIETGNKAFISSEYSASSQKRLTRALNYVDMIEEKYFNVENPDDLKPVEKEKYDKAISIINTSLNFLSRLMGLKDPIDREAQKLYEILHSMTDSTKELAVQFLRFILKQKAEISLLPERFKDLVNEFFEKSTLFINSNKDYDVIVLDYNDVVFEVKCTKRK